MGMVRRLCVVAASVVAVASTVIGAVDGASASSYYEAITNDVTSYPRDDTVSRLHLLSDTAFPIVASGDECFVAGAVVASDDGDDGATPARCVLQSFEASLRSPSTVCSQSKS